MDYVILIGLFVLFYLIVVASIFKSEGISLFGLIVDAAFVIILTVFYFIGKKATDIDISNYFYFMIVGSLVYMYTAVKMFWIKPELVQYLILKETDSKGEEIEDLESYLQTARIRSVYYFIVSVALMVIIFLVIPSPINEEFIAFDKFLVFVSICIFLVSFIIDVVRKIRYGIFFFKSIAPLMTIIWMIISVFILLKR
ncbi:DUF5080 family protein [Staphylococcus sp. EZ-P03]|uniref:DUF5080 family protein n=1 Tax=Staphylococcus sp. EZ-P03 TaxID=2282739 RepID=UPI000DF86108|nr:DUF5080 family protein [Staphylococcus sp. EZ-P03]